MNNSISSFLHEHSDPSPHNLPLVEVHNLRSFEFHFFITHHIWVWCTSKAIFSAKEVFKYGPNILSQSLQNNTEFQFVLPLQNVLSLLVAVQTPFHHRIIPVFHKNTDDIISASFNEKAVTEESTSTHQRQLLFFSYSFFHHHFYLFPELVDLKVELSDLPLILNLFLFFKKLFENH